MALSTPPILSSIVIESLKRAGYSNPSSDLQARATERWIEEIKSELWAKARDLKSLQTKAVTVVSRGVAQYSNPTDYASDMSMQFATGGVFGTAQTGTVTSITLASSYSGTEQDLIAKELVITSGTGVGGISTISGYVPATKVATLSPALVIAPDVTSGYVVIDTYIPLTQSPIWDYPNVTIAGNKGYPETFFPIGESSTGKFILNPTPWRDDTQPMVLIQRYQADLTETDTVGSLMLKLYQQWQILWICGIRWKALQNDDDDRAPGAYQEYQKAMRDIINMDTYGNTLDDMQIKVTEY